jgi:hypothetical protein
VSDRLILLNFTLTTLLHKTKDSKGIKEAVKEKNVLKAVNSFAIRDVIDGVDSPLILLRASVALLAQIGFVPWPTKVSRTIHMHDYFNWIVS